MNVLVIGSGGREHALAWKLSQEAHVFVAPGNGGTTNFLTPRPVDCSSPDAIAAFCREQGVELVVIGPEDPLVAGLADELRSRGCTVFGPSRAAAQLEASKAFSKALMFRAGIPTAMHRVFVRADEAILYAREQFEMGRPQVIKASGNALGKGVVVCSTAVEAEHAIREMMEERAYGSAADEVVIEDRLNGYEFSLLAVCNGSDFVSLPVAKDHKRVNNGDTGPNTGGMGTVSTRGWPSPEVVARAEREVIMPALQALGNAGTPFVGVLFAGLLVQDGTPYCLEFNVRFGDPETQSVVRRIDSGLLDLLLAAAKGEALQPPNVNEDSVVSIVMSSPGYPGAYPKGIPLQIPEFGPEIVVFHAGTQLKAGELVSSGGRVLCISATGKTLAEAQSRANEAVMKINFPGAHYRTDIGESME